MNQQVSSVLIADTNNLSSKDWLLDVTDDTTILSIPLDASDSGLFTGNFVPPPPRPLFLEEGITPDGLTTCDLCSWAWQNGNLYATDTTSLEPSSEIGWVLTLVIVSLTSAILGAIIMIIVLHCKRLKSPNNTNGGDQEQTPRNVQPGPNRPPINTPDDKIVVHPNVPYNQNNINGVWSWLSRRSTATPSQLENPPMSFVENHYTHMEDPYNSVDDALYAELDVESTINRDPNTAYQNSAYTDSDAPTSSAPSSAYYSDLSVTTGPDRAYEVVGLSTMPVWDDAKKQAPVRLAVISETVNVPSDYV
ncbi:uncharacterized protein LOC135128434 [Zophobas morio]|uniref:uncharacterized protein LOC135128434 n=1 Tax=Zophobas morio TaxID=2755281 RepID=UPI0030838FDC